MKYSIVPSIRSLAGAYCSASKYSRVPSIVWSLAGAYVFCQARALVQPTPASSLSQITGAIILCFVFCTLYFVIGICILSNQAKLQAASNHLSHHPLFCNLYSVFCNWYLCNFPYRCKQITSTVSLCFEMHPVCEIRRLLKPHLMHIVCFFACLSVFIHLFIFHVLFVCLLLFNSYI